MMLINIPQVSQPDRFCDRLTFYQLENNNYQVIETSKYLSNLESSKIINFINRGLIESPLTIEAEFIKYLNQ